MPQIQEWIYQLEEGKFGKFLGVGVLVAAIVALAVIFHVKQYSNLSHPVAMDMAQVGRNMSQGEGYTTKNIRPLALHVVERHAIRNNDGKPLPASELPQYLQEDRFPELNYPPLFPALEALIFKILPVKYEIGDMVKFTESKYRYQPEVLLSLVQTLLFICAVFITYVLANFLFDARVATVSAVVVLLQNYFWESVFSGLPTLLLVNFCLVLCYLVAVITSKWEEFSSRIAGVPVGTQMDLQEDFLHSLILLVLAGGVIGVGGMVQYSFLWLTIPLVALTATMIPRWKFLMSVVPILTVTLIMTPWVIRNMSLTGLPFGLAGFSIFQSTQIFPFNSLDQHLTIENNELTISLIFDKAVLGMNLAIQNAIQSLGGIWIVGFFVVSIFLPFRSRMRNFLRFFVAGAIVILVLVMPFIRVNYQATSEIASPYDLTVWLTPMLIIFSVACFFVITDQIELPYEPLRRGFPILFGVLAAMPLIWNLLPPNYMAVPALQVPGRTSAPDSPIFVYDPFYLQAIGSGFRPSSPGAEAPEAPAAANLVTDNGRAEIIMTDIPWAYSWYANRPALLLTSHPDEAYKPLAADPAVDGGIHKTRKPVRGLLITQMTLSRSMYDIFSLPNEGWGRFFATIMADKEVPLGWHLIFTPPPAQNMWRKDAYPFIPSPIYLTDKKRWN